MYLYIFLVANEMRRRIIKKLMPMLLAGAMVVTAIPLSFASPAKAAEENILKGKATKCTSQQDDGHGCRKAVDEKFNTSRWGSKGNTAQAIQIDMGAVYEIDTIKAYLFNDNRKYTYEYYVTMEPTIKNENGGNGSDNFVGTNPVVTNLQGVGYGRPDPNGDTPTLESEIRSEDYTFSGNKPVGRYLTLRVTKCDGIVCLWDIQAFGREVDDTAVKPKGDLILEAENGTLSGACQRKDSANCSNGQYVGYIGEGEGNTVTWKANVEKAGTYTLEAYFLSKQERNIEFKVNDDAKTTLTCQAGVDWDTTVVKSNNTITVKLKAGENTIVMGNDAGEVPNVDCIALTLKEADKVPSAKPEGDLILEAENGTLSGACQRKDSANCSNGQYVGYIGEGADNTVTWKANVETAGTYTVEAYFLSMQERNIEFKVNDEAKTTLTCQTGVDWENTVVKSNTAITVKLKAGENTIVMGNDAGEAPNVDCVALTLKEVAKEPEQPTEEKPTAPTQPSEDEATDPTQPSEGDVTDPTQPSEGEATDPTQPSEGEAIDPTQPSEEETTDPIQPSESEATDPTQPSESEATDPTQPSEDEATDPTQPSESEATDPTQPSEDEATDPTQPSEGEATDPTQPSGGETTDPTQPSEEEPTVPTQPTDSTQPSGSEATAPTKPVEDNNQNTQNPQTPVTEQPAIVLKGDIYWNKNLEYKVTKADATGKGTVELVGTKNKKIATVIVPATITIQGQKYNVTSIGKDAFKNCKKLKKIVIKTVQLKKVGKNALKGIKSNAKIQVPSSKLKKYMSLFKGKGQGKNVKVVK